MVFGEIKSALDLWDRVAKWWGNRSGPRSESVPARFVRLFENHGVHRNQIPRFFGHGLSLKDVQSDGALLEKLNDEVLDNACKVFAVRRQWLDGADSQPHPEHDFYKEPEAFSVFLEKTLAANAKADLRGRLFIPEQMDRKTDSIILLQELVGSVGEKAIYRYHLLNNWLFTYWKSRAYLTACVAIAWKKAVYITGTTLSNRELASLAYGETLFGWLGEGMWNVGNGKWYPEDMALNPKAFLKDIDPERDKFGTKSALELWLELEDQGLMDAGLGKPGIRKLFEEELREQA